MRRWSNLISCCRTIWEMITKQRLHDVKIQRMERKIHVKLHTKWSYAFPQTIHSSHLCKTFATNAFRFQPVIAVKMIRVWWIKNWNAVIQLNGFLIYTIMVSHDIVHCTVVPFLFCEINVKICHSYHSHCHWILIFFYAIALIIARKCILIHNHYY